MPVRPLTEGEATRIQPLVPRRRDVPHERDDDGRIVLVLPKDLHWLEDKVRDLIGGSATVRFRLDDHGTAVWDAIDGDRTVGDIARTLSERFGDAVEPALARTWGFLVQLDRKGAVELPTDQPGVHKG